MADKKILLAYPRGFCAGVRRALDAVDQALGHGGGPVYIFHEIVHNDFVVKNLRERGAIFIEALTAAPSGATLIFSAHGVSRQLERDAVAAGLRIIDATCPLVRRIHHKAKEFQKKGRMIILIGHKGHPEIIGTLGQIDGGAIVIETVAEAGALPEPAAGSRAAYLTQTTLSMDETCEIVAALERRFPDIEGGEDICYATQNRQNAVKAICQECDLLLIIGSKNSSNSNRLRELAEHRGCPAILIDGAQDLQNMEWAGIGVIGVSAGASAPECLVTEVTDFLRQRGWPAPEEIRIAEENVTFPLPRPGSCRQCGW